jgi:hypothetical protein
MVTPAASGALVRTLTAILIPLAAVGFTALMRTLLPRIMKERKEK